MIFSLISGYLPYFIHTSLGFNADVSTSQTTCSVVWFRPEVDLPKPMTHFLISNLSYPKKGPKNVFRPFYLIIV